MSLGRVPPPEETPTAVLSNQPTWPFHWAGEVRELAAAGDFSPRFDEALAQTARLGPSERKLRLQTAMLGLQHWEHLSDTGRRLTEANVDASLLTRPGLVLRGAFALRREHLVCPRVDTDSEPGEVCSRYAELRRLCDRPRPSVELVAWCLKRHATPRHPPRPGS